MYTRDHKMATIVSHEIDVALSVLPIFKESHFIKPFSGWCYMLLTSAKATVY